MIYEYARIRVPRAAWREAAGTIHRDLRRDLEACSGRLFGAWRAVIGAPVNEGVILTAHADMDSWGEYRHAERRPDYGGITQIASVLLAPSVRPVEGASSIQEGVYAHRWFDIRPGSWPDFVRLSQEGWWPSVERDGAEVQGLWWGLGGATEGDALLITRYDSMTHWEDLRYATPEAQSRLTETARQAIAQRAELTMGSVVRIMRPLLPAS